jgi:CelD/BcsL family acetyltransferase involved in cellulose biosynthesis
LRKEIELAARLTVQGRAAVRSINNVRRLHKRLVKITNQIRNLGRSH